MSDDIRIRTSLRGHPKMKKLRRRLGGDGCWALVCLFMFAGEERWDGNLAGMSDEDIELAADWQGDMDQFVETLVDIGWLDGEAGQRSIHNWHEHNPYAATRGKRVQKAKRAAAKKWESSDDASTTRSQRLAEARKKGKHTEEEWNVLLAICGEGCLRCGDTQGKIVKDHITPIYQGGSDGIENLQPICSSCNSSKGPEAIDYRPKDWLERLRNACGTPAKYGEMPATQQKNASPPHHTTPHHTTLPEGRKSTARGGAPTAKRGCRLPPDWRLTGDLRAVAREVAPDVDAELEAAKFADYWHAKSGKDATKLDWTATWRNWLRRANQDLQRSGGRNGRRSEGAADRAAQRAQSILG